MKGKGKGSGSTAMTATSSPEEIVQWYEKLARGEHDGEGCIWQPESESNSSHALMAVKKEEPKAKPKVKAEKFDISDDGSWIDADAVHRRNAGRSTAMDSGSASSSLGNVNWSFENGCRS